MIDLEGTLIKVFSNDMVDAKGFLPFDPAECGVTEKVYFPLLRELLEQYEGDEEGLKEAVRDRVDDLVPKHIFVEDIMASINYLNCLAHGVGTHDDIDHLGEPPPALRRRAAPESVPHRVQPHGARDP